MEMCKSCDIVYDSRYCPCCELQEKVKDLEKELSEVNN